MHLIWHTANEHHLAPGLVKKIVAQFLVEVGAQEIDDVIVTITGQPPIGGYPVVAAYDLDGAMTWFVEYRAILERDFELSTKIPSPISDFDEDVAPDMRSAIERFVKLRTFHLSPQERTEIIRMLLDFIVAHALTVPVGSDPEGV